MGVFSSVAENTNKAILDMFLSTWQTWVWIIVFVFFLFLIRIAAEVWIPNLIKRKRAEKKYNSGNLNANINICPQCGGKLLEKSGQFGKFFGCSNYPKCRFTKKIAS